MDEFTGIRKEINKWINKNKGNVSFVGSFVSYNVNKIKRDNEDVVKDNIIIGFGDKKEVAIQIKGISKELKKSRGNLINW